MSKAVYKVQFAGSGAGSGLHMACIADFQLNRETVDGREQEKTTFHPGEPYWFLVQHDPALVLTGIASSSGGISNFGRTIRPHEEEITLPAATGEVNINYMPAGSVGVRWYGNAPSLRQTGRQLAWRSGPLPAIGTARYQSRWLSCRLTPPALRLAEGEEWPVLIVVTLEEL